MADKETKLAIVIRTVDRGTAAIRVFKERVGKMFAALSERVSKLFAPVSARVGKVLAVLGERVGKPLKLLRSSLGGLVTELGVPKLLGGMKKVGGALLGVLGNSKVFDLLKGIGGAVGGLLSKIPLIGGLLVGAAGAATAGLLQLIEGFDDLGDKAEHIGVGVDFLAQMRYAAKKSGAEVETLDAGLQGFVSGLGQARANTGKLYSFLKIVSPALLKQLKAAKDNETAFGLLADAMAKIEDPAKRAAFAQKTLGDPALAGLLARGSKGIQELRDRYAQLAGSQQGAVNAAGEFGDSMDDLHAATDGIKAALVQGLAPALRIVVDQLRDWFVEHRGDIAEWAKGLGEKLPGALSKVVGFLKEVVGWLRAAGESVKYIVDAAKSISGETMSQDDLRQHLRKQFFSQPRPQAQAAAVANFDFEAAVDLMRTRPDVGGQARDALAAAGPGRPSEASVSVKFENAPRGMRVTVDPQSTADVDFSTGYLMGFAP